MKNLPKHLTHAGAGTLPQGTLAPLLDAVSDSFYILDKEWRFQYVNGTAIKFFKLTPEQILGKVIWDVFPGTLGSVFEERYRLAMSEGIPVQFATRSVAQPDRWLESRVYPVAEGLAVFFLDVTDKKRADAALRTNQAQMKLIIDAAPALISYIGRDYKYQIVNQAYQAWFGVPEEDVIGRHIKEVVGEQAWRAIGPSIERAMAGEIVTFEGEAVYKGGKTRWISATYTPHRDSAGQICGVMILVLDITEQKRVESALRQSEAYHRSLFEAGGVGNAEVEIATGRFLRVNQRYCELVGYSEEELLSGMTFSDITHPDDREANRSFVRPFMQRGTGSFELEKRYLRKDGRVVWVHIAGTIIRAADGQSNIMLGVAQDITERKRLDQERQKFVSLVENSFEFTGMCDLNGIPFFVNEVGLRSTGLSSLAEAKRTPVKEFFFPEDQDFVMNEFLPRVIREGRGEVEIRFRHFKTGEAMWMIYNVFLVKDSDGQVIGYATVSRDITDRRRAEQMLREADRRKDEFLATLAHELRNPLAPISNALQIWARVEKNPELATRLRETMDRQVKQLKRLIDDLLDVSRISRGKIELIKEPVDLATAIEGAIESVRPYIDACRHTLSVKIPPGVMIVNGDAGRLMQVFGNLLHNAAKYTESHGTIEISARVKEDAALVSIKDNGAGIPQEMLGAIFEAFAQVHKNLDRAQGGLGIGLTLVKNLVELHGGSVDARSEGPGKGSEFIVRLPLTSKAMVSAPLEHIQSNTRTPLPQAMPHYRVLIVDDLKASADTLALMLQELGHETSVAYDGPAALRAVRNFHPDVVISDIAMPGMDGYRLAECIRQEVVKPQVLVALTGYGQQHDKLRAFEAGFDYHLVKPTSSDVLEGLLKKVGSRESDATRELSERQRPSSAA